ncbi:putative zinc-binding peptidase [Neolewinella lacunae]|uniref:Zinc-binding peptidase n=1 Tax=Neolewinella lacunae TaxID=1517758 RepID=A0A923PLC4_9BACT|nr:putative zinc-binding peptidase [Neolewinella lacunae]MBC6993409.1 putative zinc-binding peptidase [Neolewinella lacunae]MDN3636315.1 putative zinc-binding peptidase [Neolewinella lacunae]
MKLFQCLNCAHPVFFNNVTCENCGSWLAYYPPTAEMLALIPFGEVWLIPQDGFRAHRYCANHAHAVCNWLVPNDSPTGFCAACDLNRTVPDPQHPESLEEWRALEVAKHYLVYALQRLGLPLLSKSADPERGLAFDFLSPEAAPEPVMMGHQDGLITLNAHEANPAHRESVRLAVHEKYRTLIGHFRHEVGHYYWDRLIAGDDQQLAAFRQLFGDETAAYDVALKQHYQQGPPPDWNQHFITKYASAHPWEDWAETWAHYLHLLDTLETAHAFGLSTQPRLPKPETLTAVADFDPYLEPDMDRIIDACIPITFAVNSLNRGMGRPDLYPFVLFPAVRAKLRFVHELVGVAKKKQWSSKG